MDLGLLEEIAKDYDAYMLLKFTSSYEFQQDFLDGKLYFNTSDFFARCDDQGRGDCTEGLDFIINPLKPKLQSAGLEKINGRWSIVVRDYSKNPEDYVRGSIWSFSSHLNRNRKIISLYTLYLNLEKQIISKFSDKMINEFGEFGILILDRQEFYRRVIKAIKSLHGVQEAKLGFVKYLNEETSGFVEWHPFKKKQEFKYQNEFRIMFVNDDTLPLKLDLGRDLRDIAVPIMMSDLADIMFKDGKLYYPIYKVTEE